MIDEIVRELVSVTMRYHGMPDNEWAHRIALDEVYKRSPQSAADLVEAVRDGLRQYPLYKSAR